jgi:hypothetical protein
MVVPFMPLMTHAQSVFDPSERWIDEEDPRYYENMIARHWEEIEDGQWADLFSMLAEQVEESDVDWRGAGEVRARLISALMESANEISGIDDQHGSRYLQHLDKLDTGRFSEGVAGQGFVAFNGINPPIVLCMEGAEMIPPCNEPQHPILTPAQAREVRYAANTANELLQMISEQADEAILNAIETSYRRWVNFMDRGFVMFPWELSLNSALLNWDIRTPPSTQFIFLHPSLGIQIPLDGFSDPVNFRAKETLTIEVLGHLWYRGEFLDNYSGLSATVVLREDLPPGVGFLARPGRGLAAGLNWHLSADDQKTFLKTPYVTVSINVLNFIKTNRGVLDVISR